MGNTARLNSRDYFASQLGSMVLGDSFQVLQTRLEPRSVDLIITSPPFGLLRKKAYGNVPANEYVNWFRPIGKAFREILKPSGSLVLDIGGSWTPGLPTRSLYHFELLLMLCRDCGFHLAQEFYWWNPAKLPSPAEWVTVRRIRVKDAVNCVWWLSPTPWPKASNHCLRAPYSDSMKRRVGSRPTAARRPSGHNITGAMLNDNGGSIPGNMIAIAHTDSSSHYHRYCRERGIRPHPARFPSELPEYFIRMLTEPSDLVVDPFAGSCVTGEVAERLGRQWLCVEKREPYLRGAVGRFTALDGASTLMRRQAAPPRYYKAFHPSSFWSSSAPDSLPSERGQMRRGSRKLPEMVRDCARWAYEAHFSASLRHSYILSDWSLASLKTTWGTWPASSGRT